LCFAEIWIVKEFFEVLLPFVRKNVLPGRAGLMHSLSQILHDVGDIARQIETNYIEKNRNMVELFTVQDIHHGTPQIMNVKLYKEFEKLLDLVHTLGANRQ